MEHLRFIGLLLDGHLVELCETGVKRANGPAATIDYVYDTSS